MILHQVQEEFGYVSREAADQVAYMLDIPLAKIYGVLSFYHFFKTTKPGDHNIQVCLGTACYLKGGDMLVEELGSLLGIGLNEVTEDGRFSLEGVPMRRLLRPRSGIDCRERGVRKSHQRPVARNNFEIQLTDLLSHACVIV